MRILLLALAGSLLTGCAMFDYDPAEPPRPDAISTIETWQDDEPMVERWAREQRQCEAGDEDHQRICMMGPPRE